MIGRDVLAGLDRGDGAERAVIAGRDEVAIERRIAQHQADHDIVGRARLPEQVEQREGVFLGGDDRLFAEDLQAEFETLADMGEMHVIGRTDQQQVEVSEPLCISAIVA